MTLANSIFKVFSDKSTFSLKEAYQTVPDKPEATVRARIYDNLGILFSKPEVKTTAFRR